MTSLFFAACFVIAFLLVFGAIHIRQQEKLYRGIIEACQQHIEILRAEKNRMLNTALEARGVQVIDPDRKPVVMQLPPRKGIGAKILALEKRDREEAERREAERRASMDRDERVGLEESEALRLAEQKRRELSGADA